MFKVAVKFDTAGNKTAPLVFGISQTLTAKAMTMDNPALGIVINLPV